MSLILEIAFWVCALAFAHSYFFYPLLMRVLARGKKSNTSFFEKNNANLPFISVLVSLYNEEKVVSQKLQNFLTLDYPASKLQFIVGSDGSSDATNDLVRKFRAEHPHLNFSFHAFTERRGKPPVINELVQIANKKHPASEAPIFLMTDASVLLTPDVPYLLARHFKNPKMGLVDARMQNVGLKSEGISRSENEYMNLETSLKKHESRAWGMMIGPFGGCYALRADLFEPIPPNFLVDDFYLSFRVMERKYLCINELNAICQEGATHKVKDEFRRKKRIAAGSFQNLAVFKKHVLPPLSRLGFAYFSHKVLRWFGGFLIFAALLFAGILALDNQFYRIVFFLGLLVCLGFPMLDFLFSKAKFHVPIIRHLAYFVKMNLALMAGFFQYRKGIVKNTWDRTERY